MLTLTTGTLPNLLVVTPPNLVVSDWSSHVESRALPGETRFDGQHPEGEERISVYHQGVQGESWTTNQHRSRRREPTENGGKSKTL